MGGYSWHKQKHSSMMEKYHKTFLSDLPPITFSLRPHDLWRDRPCPKIHGGAVPAVVKSWLPAAARCVGANRWPLQLRHATSGPPERPAPRPRSHFLADPTSSALEAAVEMHGASHWCLLERSGPRSPPAVVPSRPPGHPKMKLTYVGLGPNAPSSGLAVSYSLLTDEAYNTDRDLSSQLWKYKHVSVTCECAVPDPFDARGRPMEFTSVARCKGNKFYAITLQGAVAAMEVFDTRLAITAVASARAVPRSRSRFFKEYFFEIEGVMLLVYLIHHESVEVVDDVEVFRLDSDKLEWIRVERLEGKTVFLKELRFEWVESAVFGCRDSCVFFTQGKEKKWMVYDMKKCCISSI